MNSYNIPTHSCEVNGTGLERVRYFPRQLITADDMIAEQQYFRLKMRRHNRLLHGWGVVCGLKVTAAPGQEHPWRVHVEAGYALSCGGDEIYVPTDECFDLAKCLASIENPCDPTQTNLVIPERLFVAIRYDECYALPIRAVPLGCTCDDLPCEYSRTREDYSIGCIPENHDPEPPPLLCEGTLPACPSCSDKPGCEWVVLAGVELPNDLKTALTDDMIKNSVRRRLYSTSQIQQQVIDCCCEQLSTNLTIGMNAAVVHNDILKYTIDVTNEGPATALNVIVEDEPPASASIRPDFFFPEPGPWKIREMPKLRAELGDLDPGQSTQIAFAINVQAGTAYKNTATVSSKTNEINPVDNTSTILTEL